MLQFETLLLRELQQQQNRDEFCDTVLQTQGLSVPVHSCVLSAFSPWLCGALSSMPVPMAGQRWLIELQAIDAQTLLSLVSLIYSGHLNGNQEQVLSAAQFLGIKFPQLYQKASQSSNKRQRLDTEDAEYSMADVREGMTKKMQTGFVKEVRESGTQTEDGTQTNDRETQTENECVDAQNLQTIPVHLSDQLTHFVNQEPCTHDNSQNATVAIQTIHGHPDKIPATYDILAMAPEIRECNTVNQSAFQMNLFSSGYQTCTKVTFNTPLTCNTSVDLLETGGSGANKEFQQAEGNIAGDLLHSPRRGKKEQGCLRGSKGDVQVLKKPRTRSRGGGRVTDFGWRGSKRQNHTKRCGWVAGLALRGQGGGRVGRKMNTRSTVSVCQRQRGRGVLVKAGETRGCSSKGKGDPNRPRRPRGRPRLHPHPSVSHSSYYQNLVQSPDPTLLHTVPTPPIDSFLDDIVAGLHSLPLVPTENQREFMNATNSNVQCVSNSYSVQSHSNSVEYLEVKPPEGELGDILEHFLRTFGQHVGCSLDMQTETPQENSETFNTPPKVNCIQLDKGSENSHLGTISCTNSFKTCTELEPLQSSNPQQILPTNVLQPPNTLTSSNQIQYGSHVNSTVPEETQSLGLKQQVPLYSSYGLELEKPSGDQDDRKDIRMITRSQSLKRKLDSDINLSTVSSKRGCRKRLGKNTDLTEKKSPRLMCPSCRSRYNSCTPQACKSKERVSMGKGRATQAQSKKERQKEKDSTRNSLRKSTRSHKQVGPEAKPRKSTRRIGKGTISEESLKERLYKRNCSRRTGRLENNVQVGCITAPHTGQLPIQDTIGKTYTALKRMEILLQIQNEKETRQKSDQKQVGKYVKTIASKPELGPKKRNLPVQLDQHLNSGATPQPTQSEQVSDPSPDLLTSHTEQVLQASESSEEEELDVLAVSSPISELASLSAVISEAGFSTEEDPEIDVVEID